MDKLKQKSIKDYDIWEIHCKYIGSNKMKRRLKKKFCRQAKKRLKEDLKNVDLVKKENL